MSASNDYMTGYHPQRSLAIDPRSGDYVVSEDDKVIVLYRPRRKVKSSRGMKDKIQNTKALPHNGKNDDGLDDSMTTATTSRSYHPTNGAETLRDSNIDGMIDIPDFGASTSTENTAPMMNFDVEEQPSFDYKSVNKAYTQRKNSFTPKSSGGYHLKHRFQQFMKEMFRFRALKISQILLSIYIAVLTFADMGPPGGLRDPDTGFIVDHESSEGTENGLIVVKGTARAIIARSTFEVACIGIARLSAWFMYPALVFVFISKFRATTSFLAKSPLAMHMYGDLHELHVYCGWTILVCASIHSIFHIARWAVQGNLILLLTHFSGISGLMIISSCLLICIPMTIFRECIKYEIRKNLHYLFILFAGALVFHTPTSAIPNGGFTAYVFGTLIIWYFLDASYCYFFMTEKIETTSFSVVSSGVRMTMNVSKRFQKNGAQGGICYVCLPWIAKNQWHAFSLFENPTNPAERQIFIQKTGDWTTKLHRYLQRDTVRPAWVHGPFPSPYDSAEEYDNQILVASGIGITPALSVIRAHKCSRRINLIWVVRDQQLLQFFLRHMYLDHQGWNLVFYTGKDDLNIPDMDILTNTNICIIGGRPRLDHVIPNIIYGVESGLGLPEKYTPQTREVASEMLADRLIHLKSRIPDRSEDVSEDLACYASELGFHLPPEEVSREFNEFPANDDTKSRRRASATLMKSLSLGFRPWDKTDGAQEYVKRLDPKIVLPTWGMMYCGGAKMVLADLEKISDEYELGLHVESFAW